MEAATNFRTPSQRKTRRRPITGYVWSGDHPDFQAVTTDLSESGLQIQGNRILKPGSRVVLGVSYGQTSFTGSALVRWTKSDGILRSGLQFVDMDEDGHQAIRRTMNVEVSPTLNIQNLVAASNLSGECPVNATINEFYRYGDRYRLRLGSSQESLLFEFGSASHFQRTADNFDVTKYQLVRNSNGQSVHRFFNHQETPFLELHSRTFQVTSGFGGPLEMHPRESFSLKISLDKLIDCLARGEMSAVAEEAGRLARHLLPQGTENDTERLLSFHQALQRRQFTKAGKELALLTSRHHHHIPLSVRGILLRMSHHLVDGRPVLCLMELEALRDYLFAVR